MNITIENRPRSRGVTQLMYVGDDDAVENALGPGGAVLEAVVAMAASGYALSAPKGTGRTVAAGIALVALYRVLKR